MSKNELGFEIVNNPSKVKIKNTKLELEPLSYGLDYKWFYWGIDELLNPAAENILEIGQFSILELLYQPDVAKKINEELENDVSLLPIIIEEINLHINSVTGIGKDADTFKDNFYELNIFEFEDGQRKCINQLNDRTSDSKYLLLFEEIESIKNLLTKAHFICSKEGLSKTSAIQSFIRARNSIYYNEYKILNEYLNIGFETTNFEPEEKYSIFKVLENAKSKETPPEQILRMQTLKLFCNQQGNIVALGSLLKDTTKIWLKPFKIIDLENNNFLNKYLIDTDNEAYTKIVIPLWENVITDKNGLIRKDIKAFYCDINSLQELTKQNQTLISKVFIPLEKNFSAVSESIYYNSSWSTLNKEDYTLLTNLFKKIFIKDLPIYEALLYLQSAPFNLSNSSFDLLTITDKLTLSVEEIKILAKAAHSANLNLFDKFIIKKELTNFVITNKKEGEEIVWCDNKDFLLTNHLNEFHKSLFIAPNIAELKDLIVYKDTELLDKLLDEWDTAVIKYTDSFASVIIEKDDVIKNKFINKVGEVHFSFEDNSGLSILNNIIKVALSFSDINIPKEFFKSTILFSINPETQFSLEDVINSGSDTIYFGEDNLLQLKLSNIFSTENIGFAKYIESLIEKFTKEYFYDKAKLGLLFNLNTIDDKEDILNRITNAMEPLGFIANASQLAFILLYKKFINKEISLSNYLIKHQDATLELDGVFAISKFNFSLFSDDSYFDELYNDLSSLLKLSDTNPSFKVAEFSCYLQPFVENNVLLTPPLKEAMEEKEQIQLLDFLLTQHKNSTPLSYSKSWSSVFGIIPEHYVSSKYMLKDIESLPIHIFNWSWNEKEPIRKKHKASILSALGFNFPWAPINTLREVLLEPLSNKTFNIADLNDLPIELIANSLIYLNKTKPEFQFSQSFKYYDIIKEMVKVCIQHSFYHIPLPVSTTVEGEYLLRDTSIDKVHYYDATIYQELKELELHFKDLIIASNCYIYNAPYWTESQELKKQLQIIEIKKEFNDEQVIEISEEWSDSFYIEWKLSNPNKSFFYYDGLPYDLYINKSFIKTIMVDEYYNYNNGIYCPRKFSFSQVIKTLLPENWIPATALRELETLFNSHQMKTIELLSNPSLYNEVKIKVDEIKRELELQVKKNELIANLSTNEFSYKWFVSFIELQINQDNESDANYAEQEISFFAAEWDGDSKRLINFKDPNRNVTPTIEYCTDFTAIFVFNNRNQLEVKIQDISKKGQVVNAMLARPELLDNVNLKDVKRVELRFSRSVKLLDRLLKAFRRLNVDLNWQENYDLKANLTPNINFIFGPPGTGKTTLLAQRITDIMNASPDAKILVLTPTNKAADVLTQRIMKITGQDDYWLIRYGASFANDIIERDLLQNKDSFIYEAYKRCACITTIHRIPYEKAILKIEDQENVLLELGDMHWDYVVFDEASMLPITYITYALYKCQSKIENRTTTFWVAGDPLQIPPVVEIDDEDIPDNFNKEVNIYTMVGLDTFDEVEQKLIPVYGVNNKIENLTTQYRSIEQIGKLFSEFSYKGKLTHNRAQLDDKEKLSRPLPKGFQNVGIKPITLLKFPVNQDDSVYNPGKLRKSAYHIYSAILVLELIKKFNASIGTEEIWTIGIVCPYRSQATLVNKMIESLSLKNNLTVITDTVHGFQGDECDMVYFIVNPPGASISSPGYGAFIHKHYLINVAISRARDYLIILYPDNDTKGISNLAKLNVTNEGSIEKLLHQKLGINHEDITIHSSTIERQLFNQKDFIQENSRTNKHQLVNVYNLAEKPYIVRESTTAIDIQFKS